MQADILIQCIIYTLLYKSSNQFLLSIKIQQCCKCKLLPCNKLVSDLAIKLSQMLQKFSACTKLLPKYALIQVIHFKLFLYTLLPSSMMKNINTSTQRIGHEPTHHITPGKSTHYHCIAYQLPTLLSCYNTLTFQVVHTLFGKSD